VIVFKNAAVASNPAAPGGDPTVRPRRCRAIRSARASATVLYGTSSRLVVLTCYLNVQQDILETFVDRGQLRKLAEPTITSTGKRIPGLKLDHPRQLALMHALVRFAHIAAGGWQYLYDRRNPPHRHRSARLRPRTLHPRFPPLRPLETPGQGPCCQAPQLSSLSTPSSGILNLPRLPDAVRTRLRATHGRPSQPRQSRRPARLPKAIPT
jgi:hypothetical protein